MRIGIRRSPHLETLEESIVRHGDTLTSTNDTGADFHLAWGWPQAEQVARDNGGQHSRIICLDAHPFALQDGVKTGERIFQLGNWGALAAYPDWCHVGPHTQAKPDRAVPDGPVLVLGQVFTAEQTRLGLVDVWNTGGYEAWLTEQLAKPRHIYRKHPRVWVIKNQGARQPSLGSELWGCSLAVSWNSTAAIHARLLGYPSTGAEAHAWAHMSLQQLEGLRVTPAALKSGDAWARYREWLVGGAVSPAVTSSSGG